MRKGKGKGKGKGKRKGRKKENSGRRGEKDRRIPLYSSLPIKLNSLGNRDLHFSRNEQILLGKFYRRNFHCNILACQRVRERGRKRQRKRERERKKEHKKERKKRKRKERGEDINCICKAYLRDNHRVEYYCRCGLENLY